MYLRSPCDFTDVVTVYVRSRDLEYMHNRSLEGSHAFLPLAYHASTVAKNCLLRAGRAVWDLDGRGDSLDRNKMRESHSVDPVRQDLSHLRKSSEISLH